MMDNKNIIPIWEKITLSVKEAAAYSGIGINRVEQWTKEPGCNFVLFNGTHKLVKRRQFEEFIDKLEAI